MKVLLLSPYGDVLAHTIVSAGDEIVRVKTDSNPQEWPTVDFIVMFGWRNLIREPIISRYHRRIINLHGSFLPWNRGAYPNLFSWVENTPKGASIHYVDSGIDTGPIIMRHAVDFSKAPNTTLASSYDVIKFAAEEMFRKAWPVLRRRDVIGTKQDPRQGTSHTIKDAEPIIAALPDGWDTAVGKLP